MQQKTRLVDPKLDPKIVRYINKYIILAMIMYGFATPIFIIFPLLSNIMYIAIPALTFIPIKRLADSLSSRDGEKSMD
jgi:hypothetical protein